jgi:signal transduction histidine kinase
MFAVAVLSMLVIGAVEWASGHEVSMFIFYAAPILVTVTFYDGKVALLMAIMCGITWWWVDVLATHTYPYLWIAVWEPTVRFAFFAFVALAGAKLKQQHDVVRSRVALLEHSQRLEREIVAISEDERRRIGQDLHDGICQYLAGIGCAAATLQTQLLRKGLHSEANSAEELAELLREGVVQTRDLARGLVPVEMDESGLLAALEQLTRSVAQLQNIDCAFVPADDVPICDTETGTHLYRITQEAISNAARHGGAQRIRVYLGRSPRGAELRITDSGSGVTPGAGGHQGMGLRIMMYRARSIGGELTVSRAAEGGTEVACTWREDLLTESYEQAA